MIAADVRMNGFGKSALTLLPSAIANPQMNGPTEATPLCREQRSVHVSQSEPILEDDAKLFLVRTVREHLYKIDLTKMCERIVGKENEIMIQRD